MNVLIVNEGVLKVLHLPTLDTNFNAEFFKKNIEYW